MGYPNLTQDVVELQTYVKNIKTNIIDFIYPVGSIYMSVNNVSPATFLGGNWEQIQDRFLLSAGSSYAAGSTGGAATHTLTTAQIPSHTHTATTNSTGAHTHNFRTQNDDYNASSAGYRGFVGDSTATYITHTDLVLSAGAHTHTVTVQATGSGSAHNNMPPYLTVYMWKRIS